VNKLWRALLVLAVLVLAVLGLAATGYAYREATATPIVRRATVALPAWPAGARPVTALLISDIHVAGPDMPPARLARIVAQINALRPDVVLIAGDLISDRPAATRHYSMADAIAPLAALQPRLGTFAVLGNHDHWYDAPGARRALAAAGIVLLSNDAALAGPLVIGGLDDDFTGRARLPQTLAWMRPLFGAPILLSHSTGPFAHVPSQVSLMLAGHTHCGQAVLPVIGPLVVVSPKLGRQLYDPRYRCGVIRDGMRSLVVTAGLGTSGLPLRIGAPPDMWLLTLDGRARR
jgi:predicted MPP superfamily phosphohydrolase